MTPETAINNFMITYVRAHRAWGPGGPCSKWLVFYETKQAAFEELVKECPAVKEISDPWRMIHSAIPVVWAQWLKDEVSRIMSHAKCSCGEVVVWPTKLCSKCSKQRVKQTKAKTKLRKAFKKALKAKLKKI